MAYIADLDPNNLDHAADEARAEFFDAEFPEWRIMSVDPEKRSIVPANEIADAHFGFVRRYGSDDPGRYFPGLDGE